MYTCVYTHTHMYIYAIVRHFLALVRNTMSLHAVNEICHDPLSNIKPLFLTLKVIKIICLTF